MTFVHSKLNQFHQRASGDSNPHCIQDQQAQQRNSVGIWRKTDNDILYTGNEFTGFGCSYDAPILQSHKSEVAKNGTRIC